MPSRAPDSDLPWPPDTATLRRLFSAERLLGGRSLLAVAAVQLHPQDRAASARVTLADGAVHELQLQLQSLPGGTGRGRYSALCSCVQARFCEHAAAVFLRLQDEAAERQREQHLQDWTRALRRRASRQELRALPALAERDAARLLDALLQDEAPDLPPPTSPAASDTGTAGPVGEPARFQPRLRLRSWGRGEGLLGLAPTGRIGPRGGVVTLAEVDWLYQTDSGLQWQTAAPQSLLNSRPPALQAVDGRWLARDRAAEAEACEQLWASGLLPLPAAALQWRDTSVQPAASGPGWTLIQEEQFGAFWLEQVPALQAQGWLVEALPGFAHWPVELEQVQLRIAPLALPQRRGEWLLSLGVEIEGESVDLAPLLADLLRRDRRWLRAETLAAIDDASLIVLHAPGGRRFRAPAQTLKPIVAALIDLLDDDARATAGPLPLSDWDAGRLERLADTPGLQCSGDAPLRQLGERLRALAQAPQVQAPAGLGLQLRPYQLQGLSWLQQLRAAGLAGILADDMGLGKTAQALAHLLLEKQQGRLDRPALVVMPSSLLFNWQAEAARIAPGLRLLVLQGPQRQQHFGRLGHYDLVLSSYPLAWRDIAALASQPWHLLILDEAQAVKNAASRAAKALRRLDARHRLALTGTPLENHLGELWAHFDFLMPGFLGDARSFQRLWRKPIEQGGESLRAEALARRVRPFILRRRKAEVASELPPLSELLQRIELQGAQRDLYESVRVAADKQVRKVLAAQGLGASRITVLDALLKLRQVCCDPRLLARAGPPVASAKLDLLMEMLPALRAEGRRVLVFSQFSRLLDLVGEALAVAGLAYSCLSGAIPVAQRGAIVRSFQAENGPGLMLVSLKAGGVGLNLTAADTVIHLDPWWNPAVMAQATARAHRIGQTRPVTVYQLVVAGSIEERLLVLQQRKSALAAAIVGSDSGDEGAAALKFSAAELDALLAPLGPAAGVAA